MLVQGFEVSALALGSVSALAVGLFDHAPQGFVDRSTNRSRSKRALRPLKKFFVDRDGEALLHGSI
jgi:hypothetical protein